jgi:hypothetical protein
MYNECYEKMVKAKVATKLDEEVWLNREGRIVGLEDDAFVRKTSYLMRKPKFVVFVDEVGDNASQKNDGNIAGTKYVVSKTMHALKRASHHDNHFTTLEFTLADGRPLLCVINIACSEVDAKIRMGIQPWCKIEGEGLLEDNIQANINGVNKYFPFGPTCEVDGKKIPTLVTCSENGGITPAILVEALKHFDVFEIFN